MYVLDCACDSPTVIINIVIKLISNYYPTATSVFMTPTSAVQPICMY